MTSRTVEHREISLPWGQKDCRKLIWRLEAATKQINAEEAAQVARHRLSMYTLFSDCFLQPPSRELLARFGDQSLREAAQSLLGREANCLCGSILRAADADRLPVEYAALFLIPGPQQTFPFETCYREGPSREGESWSRRMLGFVALQVQRAYVEWGMPADLDNDEFPDHAGVELRFMARLVQAERVASNARSVALTRPIARAETAFLAQHILPWFPDWLRCVQGRARRPFYRTVAELLGCFLGSEKALLGPTT